jgi:hypothetical protein
MRTSHPPPDRPPHRRPQAEQGRAGQENREAMMLPLTAFVVQTEVEHER